MNRIKMLRTAKKLTQRKLAELAGTTQQTIDRVEKDLQAPRFDLAARICGVLEVPLDKVFPKTKKALRLVKKNFDAGQSPLGDQTTVAALEEAGIDTDPCHWFLLVWMSGGLKLNLPLSGREQERLYRAGQHAPHGATEFLVFDTDDRRWALNQKHMKMWHFLFEVFPVRPKDEDEDEDGGTVRIWLTGEKEPEKVMIEADEEDAPNGDTGQMSHIFSMLEMGDENPLRIRDVDGEDLFFAPEHVMALSCPLASLDGGLPYEEEEDEGEAAGEAAETAGAEDAANDDDPAPEHTTH